MGDPASDGAGFFSVLRRRRAPEVLFVWDPMCLELRTQGIPFNGEYQPTGASRRLSIIEPNIDVLKFCLYPLLIAEAAYRQCGAEVGYVHVTNTEHLARDCPEFIGIAQYLDLVREGKIIFVGCYDTPQFPVQHTDIVI